MNIGVTEVSPRAIQREAEKNFKKGYYCCEALMATIRNEFKLDVPEEVIAMSSGMAVGAGKSGCICGALNGGILALGMFFGRTEQDGPTNPKSVKCMELVHELHDWFKEANGKKAIWDRVSTKSSVSILQDFVHGRLPRLSVVSLESRIWMRLMSHARDVQSEISKSKTDEKTDDEN